MEDFRKEWLKQQLLKVANGSLEYIKIHPAEIKEALAIIEIEKLNLKHYSDGCGEWVVESIN